MDKICFFMNHLRSLVLLYYLMCIFHRADMESVGEDALQSKIKDLKANYSDSQLRVLLREYGLDKMPLSAHTKGILVKQLALRIVLQNPSALSSADSDTSTGSAPVLTKSVTNLTDKKTTEEQKRNSDFLEVQKTLLEVRESLSSCISEANRTHYAVCIPGTLNTISVQSEFEAVKKIMKEHKSQNPRMLSFHCLADAETFANNHTANEVCEGATIKSHYPQEKAEVESGEVKLFPSPTTPQINEFRIQLERGNISFAREKMLSNPRFLIGNGDMPAILKEGPRYNAMHACVAVGQLESCRLVMEMVSDVDYLKRMYGTQKRAEENSRRLIDLYLNTPDKIANKTPLHIASEKGMVEIVAFLVSFKSCIRGDKQQVTPSFAGKTPEEVACSRYTGPNVAAVKAKIIDLIQGGTCYVPLIRSDTTGPYAKVGDPYTPTSPYKLVTEIEDNLKPTVAADPDLDMKDFRNMKVWAYAGPMSPQEAVDFKKEWKSPRLNRADRSLRENLKVVDGDRGFEHFGRELADAHAISWQEYWPFLDAFADLRSEEGLEKLEEFFQKQRVLLIIQALLKKQDFISAPPYNVGQTYILQSKEDDSGSDNDEYFSAESRNDSEEEREKDSDSESEDYADFKDTRSQFVEDVVNANNNIVDVGDPRSLKPLVSMRDSETEESLTESGSTEEDTSRKQQSESEDECCLAGKYEPLSESASEISDAHPSEKDPSATSYPPDNESTGIFSSTSPSSSILSSSRHPDIVSRVTVDTRSDSLHTESKHKDDLAVSTKTRTSHKSVQAESTKQSDIDILQSPDQWKYRNPDSPVKSPRTNSPALEDRSDGLPSPLSIGIASPVSAGGATLKMRGNLRGGGESAATFPPQRDLHADAQLEESFNTTMNTLSKGLESFSILSPNSSYSTDSLIVSTETESSSERVDFQTVIEPSIHVFTGYMFSAFTSELLSRKLISPDGKALIKPESLLPIFILRQLEDQETVAVDVFLTESDQSENLLSLSRSSVLDEETHREATKNVWVNFIVSFPTSFDAKRMLSLWKDEIVRAEVEGLAQDRDAFGKNSKKTDVSSLKEQFLKSRETETGSGKDFVSVDVKVVRASTVPCKDIYLCGSVPTKVDADVYHTLNTKACQIVQDQRPKFPLVSQWLHHMEKRGKESIRSLPSPSRVLRSERREPPPISPLVSGGRQSSSRAHYSFSDTDSSPVSSKGGRQDDPIVKNLFGYERIQNK